jgi:death-on-curing protein
LDNSIIFLSEPDILEILQNQLDLYGGIFGVRDETLLDSAINTPQAAFGGNYLHKTLPSMAAAYTYHLCENHPFMDGNKRTALACALVFLKINGWNFDCDNESLYNEMIGVASGKISKTELTDFFEKHSHGNP